MHRGIASRKERAVREAKTEEGKKGAREMRTRAKGREGKEPYPEQGEKEKEKNTKERASIAARSDIGAVTVGPKAKANQNRKGKVAKMDREISATKAATPTGSLAGRWRPTLGSTPARAARGTTAGGRLKHNLNKAKA